MKRPEHELAKRIVQYLDFGADHLDAGVNERLVAARRAALTHYREKPETVFGLAWATASGITGHRLAGARQLLAITTLVLALVGVAYWQSVTPVNELADIETSLLTDELPINAYLDKGFDSWLKRSSR